MTFPLNIYVFNNHIYPFLSGISAIRDKERHTKEVNTNYKFTAYYTLFKLIQIQHHLRLETVAKGINLLYMELGLFNQCYFH